MSAFGGIHVPNETAIFHPPYKSHKETFYEEDFPFLPKHNVKFIKSLFK